MSDQAIPEIDERAQDFFRMRRMATGLLFLAAALFLAALLGEARWPWLAYLRAFAESSMVGGCADWFAVVAMFRYPLGLKIPHSAIIPRSKDRIARTVGRFISDNFLAAEILAARLRPIDMAGWFGGWLDRPGNSARLAAEFAALLAPLTEILNQDVLRQGIVAGLRRGLGALPLAPLAGKGLGALQENGALTEIAEWLLGQADEALTRNSESLRGYFGKNTGRWVPKWVDEKLADRILTSLHASLVDMRDADHGWRPAFQSWAAQVILRLQEDPALIEAGERLKASMLDHPMLADQIARLWSTIEAQWKAQDPRRFGVEPTLQALSGLLARDADLRETLSEAARKIIVAVLAPNRDRVGDYVAGVVKDWDEVMLVEKLEMQIGKDLQYVRVNGTLVGGIVGLLIFIVGRLISGEGLPAFPINSLLR